MDMRTRYCVLHREQHLPHVVVKGVTVFYCPICHPKLRAIRAHEVEEFHLNTVNGLCLCCFCGAVHDFLGTQKCNRCWEIHHRFNIPFDVLKKIAESHGYKIEKVLDATG